MGAFSAVSFENERLILIDQRKIPQEETYFYCDTMDEVIFAIKDMVVRGAPAIGAAAAYGVVLGIRELKDENFETLKGKMMDVINNIKIKLDDARPTAVNLMWATQRMLQHARKIEANTFEEFYMSMLDEADSIHREDAAANKAMAEFGNALIQHGECILTHCNTGALATVDYGTALGIIREAHKTGKNIHVYADETRPRLQGAKLTAWELVRENIPSTLIPDSVAATLIRDGKIDRIFVGADRVASNGDSANKIGTFMLSALAKIYNVPFYIAAPISTVDFEMLDGSFIEIEERSREEVTHINGVQVAPSEINVYNPAFDVTPAENITAIVTEKGIAYPPFKENLIRLRDLK